MERLFAALDLPDESATGSKHGALASSPIPRFGPCAPSRFT